MRILGIDPGITNLGLGLIEARAGELTHLEHRCLRIDPALEMCERLRELYDGVKLALDEMKPQVVSLETLYFARNAKTAMIVSQARGVALLALAGRELEVAEITPSQIKSALAAYGRASKKQVQVMVQQVLGLDEIPKPDHAADALAAAITCSYLRTAARIGAE